MDHPPVPSPSSRRRELRSVEGAGRVEGLEHGIAGGSAGGVDHIIAALFAGKVGADAAKVNYIPFSGGGESLAAILGGKAWTTARRVTIPLALPALVAGALIAFLQAMTLFGSPAILALPAGFHTMTTKIWSLFQYPPKLELAAAAASPAPARRSRRSPRSATGGGRSHSAQRDRPRGARPRSSVRRRAPDPTWP